MFPQALSLTNTNSAGADDEANKMEKGIQERQAQKQVDAKNEAAQDDVKVKDRGDY